MSRPCDPEALAGIERKIGADKVRRIVDLFLEQAPDRLRTFREALRSDDLEASAAALHSIHGSATMLGATRLAAVSEKMERLAGAGEPEPLRALIGELDDAFDEVRAFLREHRKVLGP